MGKGGVGKTTVASAIAVGLAEQGHRVHLNTTDPAAHLNHILDEEGNNHLSVSRVDPRVELEKYRNEVLSQNADSLDEDGLAYLKKTYALLVQRRLLSSELLQSWLSVHRMRL